jgi:Zn-dependent protease
MNQMTPETMAFGFLWYMAFLFSTTCHEAAHALAAKLGGDETAYRSGQVTLNPMPHIEREPWGMVIAPLVSFVFLGWMVGWGSAPYDPYWQQRHPRRAAWMALAGPAANFLLMLLAAGGIWLGLALGLFRAPRVANFTRITEATNPDALGFLAAFVSVFFLLNLLLGTFNLLPVPPLDGHGAMTLLMSEKRALRVFEFGQDRSWHLLGIMVAWYLYGKAFRYIFLAALNLLYWGSHYRI